VSIIAGSARRNESGPTSHYERPSAKEGPFKQRVIVFVHGIFGNSDDTWTSSNGAYWPKLLLNDGAFSDFDVYVANYESPILGNTLTPDEVAATLNNQLTADGVFSKHRQVVFICHSLGGLLVQRLLLTFREHAAQVPFVYFFGEPGEGAEVASIGRWLSSDPLVATLQHNGPNEYLLNTETQWRAAHFGIRRYCAYETKPLAGALKVVDRLSGTRNCDEPALPIGEDHWDIVKPTNVGHESYVALRTAVLANPIQDRFPVETSSKVRAQGLTVVRGLVVADRIGGQPLKGVVVRLIGGGATETDSDGTFTLRLHHKQPGDVIQLSVSKAEYVVVNFFQLKVVIPKNPDEEPLALVMCKKDEFEEWARVYIGLKTLQVIDENYLNRLSTIPNGDVDARRDLEQRRNQAASTTSPTSAPSDSPDLSKLRAKEPTTLYAQATSLFFKGESGKALSLLDEGTLRESAESAKVRKHQDEKEIADIVQAYLLRARLLITQFRFDEARKAYVDLQDLEPDNFDALFAFAFFDQQLNRLDGALAAYNKSLVLARNSGARGSEAKTLINMAVIQCKQHETDECRKNLEEVVGLLRQLSAHNGQVYLPDLALALNNLGTLNAQQNRTAEATQNLEEALCIRADFARRIPELYLPDVAMTLNNLGLLQSHQTLPESQVEARQDYDKALAIFRQFAASKPDFYSSEVAGALNNLGILDEKESKTELAKSDFEEALKIRRQLVLRNPEFYLPDLGSTLINLGGLKAGTGGAEGAEEAEHDWREALTIFRELASTNRVSYLPLVAVAQNNLGLLYATQNRLDFARQALTEALDIYKTLSDQNATYRTDVARVQSSIDGLKPN
jgi:tetratricopeptide (TPR) repeat protein/pimeloyl-ACP methyl ester carboxylesterase